MIIHRRFNSAGSDRKSYIKLSRPASPIVRITGKISMTHSVLSKFLQIDDNELERILNEPKFQIVLPKKNRIKTQRHPLHIN